MFSHWAYVLIGRDGTGKTMFQRRLLYHLCERRYGRLPINVRSVVTHPRAPKGFRTIFTANRSYQEKKWLYKSVENYFRHERFFKDADVCILSSHPVQEDAVAMIGQLRRRCYNVAAVFWSNAYSDSCREIALLQWDEVLWIENPHLASPEAVEEQLDHLANQFAQFLVARAHTQG